MTRSTRFLSECRGGVLPPARPVQVPIGYSQETFGDWANDAQTVQIRVQITAENDAPDLTVNARSRPPIHGS